MGNHRTPNLLSELPLGIIHIILSLLPIREAVRTSILSRQWRYIWNSIPDLAFDKKCVNPPMRDESDFKRLVHFINQALLLHEGPIHKFQLCIETSEQAEYMDQWLPFLSRNDIRVLVLHTRFYGDHCYLHTSLYSCQYLTHLKLRGPKIPPPPQSFKGFLWLRTLDLNYVEASSNTSESIVACSPMLENLEIQECGDRELTIRAPNLKYFHFMSECDELSLCTPLLEELIVHFEEIQHFSIGAESFQGSSSVLLHLRILKLYNVTICDKNVTQAVIHLITSSPFLQKLEISVFCFWEDDDPELALWDTKSVPDFTYDSLKVIKMLKSSGGRKITSLARKIIRFLLERSPVLEKMVYKSYSSVPDEELPNLMAELLSFHRASANAQIWFGEERISSV